MMMIRWIEGIILLVALPVAAYGQSLPQTPERGSPERTAILDAVRPEVERATGVRVTFVDAHVAILDGWAYVRAIPYARPEDRGEYGSGLQLGCEECDPFTFALLRNGGGGWRVAALQVGTEPAATPHQAWRSRHGAPATLFRRDPDAVALEAAMREYIDALAARDHRRWLALFSRAGPVQIVNGITSPPYVSIVTAAELEDDFGSRGGWYGAFFGVNVDPVTGEREFDYYAEGFDNRMMWRQDTPGLYIDPTHLVENGLRHASFVRWKKERDRWVVVEIGVVWS
jgi:hypothetical protein